MKSLEVQPGDIYFIPLFLGDDYSLKSYSRYKFGQNEHNFCFCRIIKDEAGSGVLIEIYDYIGDLNSSVDIITSKPRLIEPVRVAGEGIVKKRWRKVGESINYDMELDSSYSQIRFVFGRGDDARCMCNGHEFSLEGLVNIETIESAKIWTAAQLENRIIKLVVDCHKF